MQFFPILAGSDVHSLLEYSLEVQSVGKSAKFRYLGKGKVALLDKFARQVYSLS